MSISEPWTPVDQQPGHPLAVLDGASSPWGRLHVMLGPVNRYGARWFRLHAHAGPPVLEGLHHRGSLPPYCWIEVARTAELGDDDYVRLFALLRPLVPPGGHVMVEYDSPARAETAEALAEGVPPVVTPLGAQLVRAGFAPRFKDWSISEGGREGPRKLQCYVPADDASVRVWRDDAVRCLQTFLASSGSGARIPVQRARERAQHLLAFLGST